MSTRNNLVLPNFYKPGDAGFNGIPDILGAVEAGLKIRGKLSINPDDQETLAITDPSMDFLDRVKGSLYVPCSEEDLERINIYMLLNVDRINKVVIFLDWHPYQHISFRSWWRHLDGITSAAGKLITPEEIYDGTWSPIRNKQRSIHCVEQLAADGFGGLAVFNEHCIMNTPGANPMPKFLEVLAYWSTARGIQPTFIYKANVEYVDQFGGVSPCVHFADYEHPFVNQKALDVVIHSERIKTGGWGGDYCVRHLMVQWMKHFEKMPYELRKIEYVKDWVSLVFPEMNGKEYGDLLDNMSHAGIQVLETASA